MPAYRRLDTIDHDATETLERFHEQLDPVQNLLKDVGQKDISEMILLKNCLEELKAMFM